MFLIYWFKLLDFPIFENSNWLSLSTSKVYEHTKMNSELPSLKDLYPLHQEMRYSNLLGDCFQLLHALQGAWLESDQPCR